MTKELEFDDGADALREALGQESDARREERHRRDREQRARKEAEQFIDPQAEAAEQARWKAWMSRLFSPKAHAAAQAEAERRRPLEIELLVRSAARERIATEAAEAARAAARAGFDAQTAAIIARFEKTGKL